MESVRLEEVIGEFVTLKKKGTNWIGNCPFHQEKTPSFVVTPAKNLYKCFGCGASGNAVGFLMDHDHLSYPDAIRWLAGRYNIIVEEEHLAGNEEERMRKSERDRLYDLHELAGAFYRRLLHDSEEGQAIGFSYFRERGLNPDTMNAFGLGYSRDARDAFLRMALESGYSEDETIAAGLSARNEQGQGYDRFRGRVMFPFYNLSGKIIAFGGRSLRNDKKEAKYLNSPETLIYSKGDGLYGLFQARKAIQKKENAYLVEGYIDLLTLVQSGIEEVVASSGTALTQRQARLLSRMSPKVTLLYDGDEAGQKAALRGVDILLESDINVFVVTLPEGEDPDSYCRKLGANAFREFLHSEARDFLRFKTSLLIAESGGDPLKKAEMLRELATTIACIYDPLKRSTYCTDIASRTGVSESVFVDAVNRARIAKATQGRPEDRQAALDALPAPTAQAGAEPGLPDDDLLNGQQSLLSDEHQEEDVIRLLLQNAGHELRDGRSVVGMVVDTLDEVSWDNPFLEIIFRCYEEYWKRDRSCPPSHELLNHPDEAVRKLAARLAAKQYNISRHWSEKYQIDVPRPGDRLLEDVMNALHRVNIKKVIRLMHETLMEMKQSAESGTENPEILENFLIYKDMHLKLSRILGSVVSH
jgi:DNA primase